MSDSVWPHRQQPTRLPRPWDSPGKNTGVGCHFLLQCMKVKSESEVTQSCLTLGDLGDCSPPGSSVHGIFQARVLEWGAIAFSVCVYIVVQLPSHYWALLISSFLTYSFIKVSLYTNFTFLIMALGQNSRHEITEPKGISSSLRFWIFIASLLSRKGKHSLTYQSS